MYAQFWSSPSQLRSKRQPMIFRGPYPEVTIPEVSITPFVFQNAAALANKPALIEGETGRTITYAQLEDSIKRAAAGLAARGFKQHDVFGILSPNVPEFAIAFHAVAKLGGVCTTGASSAAPNDFSRRSFETGR